MRTFILRYEADARSNAQSIEFHGEDAHQAFAILEHARERRRVTVWEGATCLGSVMRNGNDLWELGWYRESGVKQVTP